MEKRKEFYVGWQGKMPPKNKAFLKRFLIALIIALPLLVAMVMLLQKPFNNHQFEFGNIKNITGTYYDTPLPILVANNGILPDSFSNNILLVGYGKFGAEGIMQDIEVANGDLNGKRVTLAGTLIYGDGKTLMELTHQDKSLIEIIDENTLQSAVLPVATNVRVKGEILDPKCYFGVMKPGEGKVHKSCAIRCISGGIPPVLRHETGDKNSTYRYYIMVDKQVIKSINKFCLM